MTGPPAATAAVRVAVRRALADLSPDAAVAVAVSGGADSLAVAAGLAFVRPDSLALVVDHGLQPGSAAVAARAAEQCRTLGLEAVVLTAPGAGGPRGRRPPSGTVTGTGPSRGVAERAGPPGGAPSPRSSEHPQHPDAGDLRKIVDGADAEPQEACGAVDLPGTAPSARSSEHPQHPDAGDLPKTWEGPVDQPQEADGAGGGPEARARAVRYAALGTVVEQRGLAAVLLGHTCDDQAETVLLGLARGSGARALAGMAPVRGPWRRPLLGLDRATTRAACAQALLVPWEDPHNADPSYARVRVRTQVLPVLEQALGPGVAAALARTAQQLREDADALDALTPDTDEVAVLAALPAALRARALKRWAEGACGTAVSSAHVAALRALVEDWRGQGEVALPRGVRARRSGPRLASAP